MGFDDKAFKQANFKARTDDIRVPELADFFGDDDPVWTVRGITGLEVGKANQVEEKYKQVDAAGKAMAGDQKEKIEAFKTLFGITEGLSPDFAKRTEILVMASVNPVCDIDMACRVRDHFPGVFVRLTQRIYELTGLGSEPGKLKGSGGKPKSKPA